MNRVLRLAAIGFAAALLAACSGTSSSIPSPMQHQGAASMARGVDNVPGLDLTKVHIFPTLGHRFIGQGVSPQTFCWGNKGQQCGPLSYQGGPVLVTPRVYVVFWGFGKYGDPSKEQKYLKGFLNGVGGSKWESDLTQYYQIVSGKKSKITNPTGQLKGTWVDNTHPVPSAPSDAQIQAEAANLVTHFGYNKDASYVVATPTGHSTPGFGSSFCAYHGAFSGAKGLVSYTNLPYQTDAGFACGAGFINSPGTDDGLSIVEGHEYAESITDVNPPSAWYNGSFGEIGDECAWLKPPAGDITLSTGKFAVQGLYSNKSVKCSIKGP
jgi:hypothetical protein